MIINEEDYLEHFGVKGMKWGVRKQKVLNAKSEYKKARKAYNKSYNKAYNYSANHPYSQFVSKKGRAESENRWEQASSDADRYNSAKSAYKSAKRERKNAIKDTYKDINKNTSFYEKVMFDDATRKRAAKYVVDNDMSVSEATAKAKGDAVRNTAILLAAYGAVSVASRIRNNYK